MTLAHECGHYIFGFGDEYRSGDYNKSMDGNPEPWTYRDEHNGSTLDEPNEFPLNYGVMDTQFTSHELSDYTDYYWRSLNSEINRETVTSQWYNHAGLNCWTYFEIFFEDMLRTDAISAGLTDYSDSFFRKLINPPHNSGWYPQDDRTKREQPEESEHHRVNFVEWWPTGLSASLQVAANTIINATITVVDQTSAPVANAQIWRAQGKSKSFLGKTNAKGKLRNVALGIDEKIEVYFSGQRKAVPVGKAEKEILVTLPFRNFRKKITSFQILAEEQTAPGIVVSAKPQQTFSNLDLYISGNPLSSSPQVTLSQPTGFSQIVSMLPSGNNSYAGVSPYTYHSGRIAVTALAGDAQSDSLNQFRIYSLGADGRVLYYSSNGELELVIPSSSFSGAGKLVIVDSSAPAPANNGLVQVGNVYSIGFSDGTSVQNIGMSIKHSLVQAKGVDKMRFVSTDGTGH